MQQGQRFEEDKFIYETNRSSCRARLKRITIFFHDTFNLLINNYDQFLYFYLPAPSYTPKILNFIRYFQKIPIWSPISSNGINVIQRVSRVFIKEKRKNLKRSNNNKLIKKKKSTYILLLLLRNLYPKKSTTNPCPVFKQFLSLQLARSHQNPMFPSNRFISPFFSKHTNIYICICATLVDSLKTRGKVCQDLSPLSPLA